MSWFGDTVIYNEARSVEMKIIAGTSVILIVVVLVYLCLRVHNKVQNSKMRETAQKEVRLNNLKV